jgi:hypothetical protein
VFALHPEIEVVLSNEFSPTNLANEKFCRFQKQIRILAQAKLGEYGKIWYLCIWQA